MKWGFILSLMLITTACSHQTKKSDPPAYSPNLSFTEQGVEYKSKLALPKKFKEKLPLVIVIHEWWGRNEYINNRVQMLNNEGFAALAVDLYGNNQTAPDPQSAQALATPFYQNPMLGVERLNKFIELAKKDPHIDANKIVVIGYCFGGTQALNLARSGAQIAGVVSFHGDLKTSLKTKENLKTKILVLNGAADLMVPFKDVVSFKEEMKKAKLNAKVINYPAATHAFTNPAATEIGKKYKLPIAYNQAADTSSWKEMLIFLRKI